MSFPPLARGQIENVDGAFAIGRDMSRMDRMTAIVDGGGERGEKRWTVAGVHFDDGGSAGRALRDRD